jgi:hypothetical protein
VLWSTHWQLLVIWCVVQAWFPSNFANISSSFQALSALDYYIFLLNQLPTVAFSSSQLPAFIASDVRVSLQLASYARCTHQGVSRTPRAASASCLPIWSHAFQQPERLLYCRR